MSVTDTIGDYPDRGNNCVVCDSWMEFDKFVCTFCMLAQRYKPLRGTDS